MASFKDPHGVEWKLRLTVGSLADVKAATGVNLAITARDADWVDAIFGDPAKLVEVLWTLCEGQAKERGLSPELFGHLFDGPTVEAAGDALAQEVANFFPRSRVAKAIRENWAAKIRAAEDRVIAELGSTGSTSPTSSPASSGATPAG